MPPKSKTEFMRVWNSGRVVMSAANVFTTASYDFPYISIGGKNYVPMVHKILLEYGIGVADVLPGGADFFEVFIQLTSEELTQSERLDVAEVIASHALLLIQGTLEIGVLNDHHGPIYQTFDPPLALPFSELWVSLSSVNAAAGKTGSVRIYYTLEEMSAEEILIAREMFQ